jgi:hypothetical protein
MTLAPAISGNTSESLKIANPASSCEATLCRASRVIAAKTLRPRLAGRQPWACPGHAVQAF